jgi:16S rRNA (guanine(966)-N(2))-methyltransferase RsmD
MLRVITGTAKNTQLKVPETGLRPATDLVRGAIFSMLQSLVTDWSNVLDVFSGSGAFGIEAISRGAGWVDFVDREPRCCAIIKMNLEKTKFTGQSRVHCMPAARALSVLDKVYNVVIMDPPYPDHTIGEVVEQLANSKLINQDSIVVVTHSSRFPLQEKYGALTQFKERRHGDSTISIYRKENLA